jgi:murein DD-endopeptidase MepM/ murein hydrolase activator NlpD
MVRDGSIPVQEGQRAVADWASQLEAAFPRDQSQKPVFFPLGGYSIKDVGGKNGNGYRPGRYRFLDGNQHLGHPAQDIFICDRDQDGLDDLTSKPVDVLAITDGVVLSTFSGWEKESLSGEIRGGNYIWIYHPTLGSFSYYAHLAEVFVRQGERVPGGRKIASLGRTGKNASLLRSPTHLHLMILSSRSMSPLNPFPLLKSSTITGCSAVAPTSAGVFPIPSPEASPF